MGADMQSLIGKNVYRVDALDKVTGQAVYNGDLSFPGMLYGRVLHSTRAHALIKRIDVSRALAMEGVEAVVTGEELSFLGGEAMKDMPFLAKGKVRYCGEPVAAVAAIDARIALRALQAIEVEYEPLPAMIDVESALAEGASMIHENIESYKRIKAVTVIPGTNVCNKVFIEHGDIEKGFAEADRIFENTYTSHDVHHAQIEPFSAIAQVEKDGLVNVWTTNSSVHRLRKDLSDALCLPENKIRIIANYIGGSFGGKGGLKVEPIAIALALRTKHRPVKIVYTREESFEATLIRHSSVIHLKTGISKEGLITARKIDVYFDTGAYSEKGPTVIIQGCDSAGGPYRIPHIQINGYCVYTNKNIAGAYRGYGVTQPIWAGEAQMDEIAIALGIDPLAFRMKNALLEGDENCLGHKVWGVGLRECLQKASEAIGWDKKAPGDLPAHLRRGKGIAVAWEPTKTPSGSGVFIVMNLDGSVNVIMGASEVGQGSRTVLAQIAAEALRIPLERVTISFPDTAMSPFDASTTASRTTFHMGNAILEAAGEIVKELLKHASNALDVSEDVICLDEGRVYVQGDPGHSMSYREVISSVYGAGGCILGKSFYYPTGKGAGIYGAPSVFWMFGAQAAEIEVDLRTGVLKVLKVAAAHNVGKAINPLNCMQQIEGGVVQGVSNVLYEEIIRKDGRILNPNFHDYKIATAMDIPAVVPILVEEPDPQGPFGAKGIGEPAIIPTCAAISNAFTNATGIRSRHMFLKPEIILSMIQGKMHE